MVRAVIACLIILSGQLASAQPFLDLKGVHPLSDEINSSTEESYPLLSPDGRLYFVRSLYENNVGGKQAGQDIWFVEKTGSGWSAPSNALGKLNNVFNNGVVGIADSGKVLYLNSTYSSKPEYQVGLTRSEYIQGRWSSPQRVGLRGFNPNNQIFSFYVDEKNDIILMSFANRDPSNEDIYFSLRKGSGWSKPINMGGSINTDQAEFAPFLSEDGQTLYFSSNGYPGKGDVDIYMSRRMDESWTHWSKPVSLPEPINSAKFDAYFTLSGTEGYFSSNRDSEFANLYKAEYEKREIEEVVEEITPEELFAEEEKMLGYVSTEHLTGLEALDILDKDGKVVQTIRASESGEFVISGLEDYSEYFLDLKGENLEGASVYILNKSGERVYLNQDLLSGKYPFETLDGEVKAILIAEVKDESHFKGTYFQLEGESVSENVTMSLYDAAGEPIETVEVDEEGRFEFKKMQIDKLYTMKGSEAVSENSIYLQTDTGRMEVSGNILKGLLFKKIRDGSIVLHNELLLASANAAKFAFEYASLGANGSIIELYDENGNLIEKTFVNENGLFAFSKLDAESNYSIKLDENIDPSAGTLFGYDEEGNKIELASAIAKGQKFKGNPAFAGIPYEEQETFSFDEANKPAAGSKVYLTDEEDNVIDSAVVDSDGNFQFTRLSPDHKYKIKLADTQDKSMGLDRFFVIDAEGNKVAMNEDGVTEKEVVGKALAETTETFQFDEENLPEEGSTVYLTDENDVVVDSAVVDESGQFRFTRLKPDGKYKLKLAATQDKSMGLSRFFVIDAEGQKIAFNEEGVTEKNLVGKELAQSTDRFSFDPDNLPPAGTVVYLTDDDNQIVDSAIVDEGGDVRFKRLDDRDTYKMKLSKSEDASDGLSSFFVVDAKGEKISFDEEGLAVEPLIGKDAAMNTETFAFEYDNLPPAGTRVYLTDENDNVVDSAIVDENGEFRFLRLSPYGNYKIKIDETQDLSQGLAQFFIKDALGNKIAIGEDGRTEKRIAGKAEAEITKFYTFGYKDLPPDGTIIYITNDRDDIVDSIIVKNGGFSYRKLGADEKYAMQLKYPDGSMHLTDEVLLKDDTGKTLRLANSISREDYFSSLTEVELEERYDQFKFEGEEKPMVGTKIYIYSEAGVIKDSAILYSHGRFNVEKLKRQEGYIVKVADDSFEVEQAELYSLVKEEKRRLSRLKDGYNYRPITIEAVDDTQFNFDRFMIDTDQEIGQNAQAFLYENESASFVDSSQIASDGTFSFKKMDRSKNYSLSFDETIDLEDAQLYSVVDDEKKAIESTEDGYEIKPDELLQPDSEEITLALGSVRDDQHIAMKKKQETPVEPKEEGYRLTPPVDEKEEPIEVKKDVVNETVFEPEPKEEKKPETTTAQPVMDDSDWKPQLEIGEVYATKKGWNLHFGFNEFLLSENQIEYLYQVVIPLLRKNPNMTLTIEGHTDSVGTEDVNHRMAILRASNVLYHLEMSGIEDTRFKIVPKGEGSPIADNNTSEGRAKNRRVELVKKQNE